MKTTEKLFRVTMSGGDKFYVIANDPTSAAIAAEEKWADWDYSSTKGKARSIEVVADQEQYRPTTLDQNLAYLVLA